MIDYSKVYENINNTRLKKWLKILPLQIEKKLNQPQYKNISQDIKILEAFPLIKPSEIILDNNNIIIGKDSDCTYEQKNNIEFLLRKLSPWRKGPYNLFGIYVDTEWRSDLKWDRLKEHIKPLKDRLVLDIGCGNGYHCWRMAGEGAKLVIGAEPMLNYIVQFQAVQHFINNNKVSILPLKDKDLPDDLIGFDTVFSMGVLYHQRSPMEHLIKLRSLLHDGGELVLETLVVDGKLGYSLIPEDRYAKMRNVWSIPSCLTLEEWLKQAGFKNIRIIDITKTTTKEQRFTNWIEGFESLESFLDSKDNNYTVEGYLAPKRAVVLAEL
jgi:tRNA (mo5U34)-methyltransferase